MNNYLKVLDTFNVKNAFVLGAGPSLWFYLQQPFFKKIKAYGIVISTNSSILANKDPDIWVSNDVLCRRWSWYNDVLDSKAIKIVRNSWEKHKADLDGFLFFEPRKTSEDIIFPDDTGLCYCSSPCSALDLAIKLNCKKIFLFGIDHNQYHDISYFWQFFKRKDQPLQIFPVLEKFEEQQKVFKYNNMSYLALKDFAEMKKAKIYNCNIKQGNRFFTKVDIFDLLDIDEVEDAIK